MPNIDLQVPVSYCNSRPHGDSGGASVAVPIHNVQDVRRRRFTWISTGGRGKCSTAATDDDGLYNNNNNNDIIQLGEGTKIDRGWGWVVKEQNPPPNRTNNNI